MMQITNYRRHAYLLLLIPVLAGIAGMGHVVPISDHLSHAHSPPLPLTLVKRVGPDGSGSTQAKPAESGKPTADPLKKNPNSKPSPSPMPKGSGGPHGPMAPAKPGSGPHGQPAQVDHWDALFIKGAHVGYTRTRVWFFPDNGQMVCKTQSDTQMTINRQGQTLVQQMSFVSIANSRGQLQRCNSRISAGGGEITMAGRVIDQKLVIETTSLGKTSRTEIPWPTGSGFFVVDHSLANHPMHPGEKRTLRGLLPLVNQAGETELEAIDHEMVEMLDGDKKKLLKIQSKVMIGGAALETTLWTDDKGRIQKTLVPGLKQETFRTTKERATQKVTPSELDLMAASVVRVKGLTKNFSAAQRVVYKAQLKSGEIRGVLAPGFGQRIQNEKGATADFEVRLVTGEWPKERDIPQVEPTAKDLQANNFLQSDDSKVVALAKELGTAETDAWKLAKSAEAMVHSKIKRKDFSQAFATAAEVARDLEGDCTEHAVLLAAVCRARKIPAKVCIGLVYVPNMKGFAFHAWNEVWVKDRWIPLDATLGRGFVPPDHIKLADTNLDGGNAFAAVLPVVRAMGQLELEVVTVE